MKTAIKRSTMWLYNHGMISVHANNWVFSIFGLRSA